MAIFFFFSGHDEQDTFLVCSYFDLNLFSFLRISCLSRQTLWCTHTRKQAGLYIYFSPLRKVVILEYRETLVYI